MRLFVLLLALAIGFTSVSSEAKSHKKKHRHKTHHAAAVKNSVNMDMQFEVNGSLVATPHVAVPLGNKATITQTTTDNVLYTIAVTPTKPKTGQVQMAFEISRTIDGRTEVLGAPRITSLLGEKARVEQKSDDGRALSLEVTAKM